MAKTKFLSRVLAVLMALSMLCSTGVFADYNSGLLAGEAAVTGEIALTKVLLNDKLNLNAALEADLAKWASTEEGIKINLAGTTSAQTGTLTYLIAPVDTLEAVPLDVAAMEAQSLAIGATEFTGGAFDVTIEADKAKIVAGTTYELRFAYSKTDIADVLDASALVYQRYIKAYDWAEGASAARVINKQGIGDITIDIQTNPIRNAVIKSLNLNAGVEKGVLASPLHIRTADLKTGDAFQIASSARVPSGFMWAGETTQTEVVTTSERSASFVEVGENLRGGVVLAPATSEQGRFFGGKAQTGNAAYRFKATNAGEVYLLAKGELGTTGWTRVTTGVGKIDSSSHFNGGAYNGYLYTTREVTLEDVQTVDAAATEITTTNLYNFLKANQDLIVKAGDDKTAVGWYHGAASGKTVMQDTTYHGLDEAFVSQDGYFQMPTEWTDENGEWILKQNYPNFMGIWGDYGYSGTACRGWLRQPKSFNASHVYTRTFEAGEWVEIPYDAAVAAEDMYTAAVIQFDVPAAPLASATVTTTKSRYFSDALPMMDAATVELDAANPVISVPRGTETVSFTVADANGSKSEAVSVTMDEATKVATAVIGNEEYEITVQFAQPTIYNYDNNYSYDGALRIALQYGDLSNVTINGKKQGNSGPYNLPAGDPLSSQTFANGAVKPALDANLISIGTYDNKGQSHMMNFDWKETDHADGMTFNVSAPATVYVLSVATNKAGSENLDEAGYTKNGTINGFPLYEKHFNAGAEVSIPTEPVTQAELDAENAKLTTTKWIFTNSTNKELLVEGQTDKYVKNKYTKDGIPVLFNIDEAGNPVSAVKASASNATVAKAYTRTQSTIFYVVFDTPAALDTLSYTIGAGDAQAITLAEGATEATVEVPYGTTDAITLAGTVTGTGSVEVSDALVLSSANKSGTITASVKNGSGEVVATYTVTFVWGAPEAPKLNWTSALAITKAAKTQAAAAANTNLYAKGIYGLGEVSGTIELNPEETEVTLTVPYGVEAVKLNNGEKIDLLGAANHTATTTVTVQEVEYTVTIAWAAYEYAAGMPLLYDLEYHYTDKTSNVAEDWYYAVPSNLVLNADMDVVYGEGDLKGTYVKVDEETGKTTTTTVDKASGTWFTADSQVKGNYGTVNNGANINRHRISPYSFESFVANGDIDDKYAFDGATILVTHYKDSNAVSPRFTFKSAVDGYVIVAGYKAQNLGAGWTQLDDSYIQTTTASTGDQTTALKNPPEGHENVADSFGENASKYSYIYAKAVDANEVVEIAHTAASGENPPFVMVVTEDMLNERVAAPTVLESLSYTTALAVTEPKSSGAANTLHTGGFYRPTLVTEAETVAVAADATTVNVTVPYGSEIVTLAGMDNYEGAVEFDAINLINNNGAATVKKTVGEIEYTINVAWAAADDATMGLTEGNLVYDVKYRVKDLYTAGNTYYNIYPSALVLNATRATARTENVYKTADAAAIDDGKTGLVYAAGTWYTSSDVMGKNSNLMTSNNGGHVNRGRASVLSFEPWVRAGLVTESGIPGAALADDVTDEAVDAIAAAALNGTVTFVADYRDIAKTGYTGVNAEMTDRYSFRVAQDSIVYVSANSVPAGFTRTDAGKLNLHNQDNKDNNAFVAGTTTSLNNAGVANYSAGATASYKFVRVGELVTISDEISISNGMPPVIIVRPVDFSSVPAPTLAGASYKIGDGEATAIDFGEGTTATIEVPWGTTGDISVTAVVEGLGGATVSDAINLETADGNTADITITVTPTLGGDAVTYTVTFLWGAAPAVEAVTYSTAATLYKVATATDVVVDAATQTITVPYGTANVTVSYKIEGKDAVALKAVDMLATGTAAVDVALPTETITLNFAWGAAPAGQYITGLTKTANNWRDRMFVSYGDIDNAATAGNSGYAPTGSKFFFDGDVEYSSRLPEGLAKRGEVAVIADAGANTGLSHMKASSFPYAFGSFPATDASNAWMTFTVAKAGTIYHAPSSRDESWTEGEALGWTVAPFGLAWAAGQRKLYQKKVAAGETVLLPNNQVKQAEVDSYNDILTGFDYVAITQEEIDALKVAVKEANENYVVDGVEAGDLIAKYTDEYLAAGEGVALNFLGFRVTEIKKEKDVQFLHYSREDVPITFVVADDSVAAELKAPKYTGATIVAADESIELSASKALYAEDAGEITFELKETAYATLEGNVLTANRDAWVEGAAVEVIVKQTIGETVLESTAVITIGAVDTAKYGYLTIAEPEGNGVIEGYLGEELVLDSAVEAMEFAAGETVKLVATPVGDYEFKYWALVDANGKETIYAEKNEVIVTIPHSITLKPVFAAVVEGAYTVTFKGYQGAIIASYNTASVDTIVTPEALSVFGYDFVEYKIQNTVWADTYGEGDTIAKELIDRDLVFVAQYEQKAEMVYTVTVVGGTVNEAESAEFKYNTLVTVVAGAAEEGMKFSHWVDEAGQILSYDAEFKFYMAAADRTVTAVYVEEDATVSQAPVITMTVTTINEADAKGPIYGLYAERRVPDEYTVVQNGIIWGVAEDATDAENITHANKGVTNHPKGDSKSKFQNNNGQYTVQLQMTEDRQSKGDKWYARTFLTFVDANGTPTTIYSNPALIWEKQ